MEYNFNFLEKKWQDYWRENNVFKTEDNYNKEKFYILDMFPYPSGSGLHVGHPLGYIASDIIARYKKMQGFNVLHPMGYDSFGLPAEQYAIQTGQHPSLTTEKNKSVYRKQLDKIGFSFDWERISLANKARRRSGATKLPFSSTIPILSPSPSTPIPNSALIDLTLFPKKENIS